MLSPASPRSLLLFAALAASTGTAGAQWVRATDTGHSAITGSQTVTVSAPPWSVTLGVSATSVTVGTTVTLTAQANQDVGPTSYYIVILDSHNAVVTFCGSGTTCVTSVTSTAAGPQTYHAVIGASDGTSPLATSATRTVTWTQNSSSTLIWTDKSTYTVGDPATICWSVQTAGWVDIHNVVADGSYYALAPTFYSAWDSGSGGCDNTSAAYPEVTALEIDLTVNGVVIATAQTPVTIMP